MTSGAPQLASPFPSPCWSPFFGHCSAAVRPRASAEGNLCQASLFLPSNQWHFQQDPAAPPGTSRAVVGVAAFRHSNLPHVLISPACQTPFDTLFKGAVVLQMGLIQLPLPVSCSVRAQCFWLLEPGKTAVCSSWPGIYPGQACFRKATCCVF